MKIIEIDSRLIDANFRNLIVTQIHTDTGLTGISEVVTKRFDDATLHGIRNLTENIGLIGKDPRQPNLHFERINCARNSGNNSAKPYVSDTISGRLKPGVSARSDPCPIEKSSTCLVVCIPLFNFFETDEVGKERDGIK